MELVPAFVSCDAPRPDVCMRVRARELSRWLTARGFRFSYRDAIAHLQAAQVDETLGTTPVLMFDDGIEAVRAGAALHLARRGEAPICGGRLAPDAEREDLCGIELPDAETLLCRRCRRSAELAGLTYWSI